MSFIINIVNIIKKIIMKIVLYIVLICYLIACSKYTTPKKVHRKLVVNTWLVNEFIDNQKSIVNKFSGIGFNFAKDGTVLTTSQSRVSGTWSVGSNSNPAIIYLNFPNTDSMNIFSDDWIVYKLTSLECILKRKSDNENYNYTKNNDRLRFLKKK